jgi:hypothetical protein
MDCPGTVVSAEKHRQNVKLNRFIDSQTRQYHHYTEQQHATVAEALKTIVEIFSRGRFANSDIVGELSKRVGSVAAWKEQSSAPFAAAKKITRIDEPIDDEEPGDCKMSMAAASQPSTNSQP